MKIYPERKITHRNLESDEKKNNAEHISCIHYTNVNLFGKENNKVTFGKLHGEFGENNTNTFND